MKKKITDAVILVFMLAVTSAFILVLSVLSDFGNTTDKLFNSFLSKNVIQISVSTIEGSAADLSVEIDNLSDNYIVYKNVRETKNRELDSVRAVYTHGDTEFPPMLSGRYFTADELENGTPTAVVGALVSERSLTEKNGEEIYTYFGTDYTVIGIMCAETASDLDSMVLLNMKAYMKNAPFTGIYYIDGGKSADVEEAYKSFIIQLETQVLEGRLSVKRMVYENGTQPLNSSVGRIFVLALLMAGVSVIIVDYYFTENQMYEMSVKKLCGASPFQLISELSAGLLVLTATAFLIGAFVLAPILAGITEKTLGFINLPVRPTVVLTVAAAISMVSVCIIAAKAAIIFRSDISSRIRKKDG